MDIGFVTREQNYPFKHKFTILVLFTKVHKFYEYYHSFDVMLPDFFRVCKISHKDMWIYTFLEVIRDLKLPLRTKFHDDDDLYKTVTSWENSYVKKYKTFDWQKK